MPRVYKRSFDWDEARRRYQAGETKSAIARSFGVSPMAVHYAVDDEARRLERINRTRWQRSGVCPDCGGQSTRVSQTRSLRCRRCAVIAATVSVRKDTLQCVTCQAWKPDTEFPSNVSNSQRRGRHQQCRGCQTKQKRAWRKRNPDYERDYARARRTHGET